MEKLTPQGFVAGVGVKIITHPDVQAALKKLALELLASDTVQQTIDRQADRQADKAIDKFMGLLPLAAAAAGESVVKQLAKAMPDIDIPLVSNVYDLTEDVRNRINGATPPGINIPSLNDFGKIFGL
jgi:hypothetical protein